MNLMNVIGGISDQHIEEFAYISPKKRRIRPWMIASAACLAVFAAAMVIVPKIRHKAPIYNYFSAPYVYFNDMVYDYYGRSLNGYSELPDGYVQVGEITTIDSDNQTANGYGMGVRVGEKIYQDPEHTEDLYVYTVLFSGGQGYRYVLFTNDMYERVRINGRTYVWDEAAAPHERMLSALPDGYAEAGEVTTNNRKYRYDDGFGQDLDIGDKIYCSSEDPDVVYVYTEQISGEYYFVKLVLIDE